MVNDDTEKRKASKVLGSRESAATMNVKQTKLRAPRRSTRPRNPTEEGFLAEITDDTDFEHAINGEGSVSLSRATSVSELTEADTDSRPTKRARSKRSSGKEELDFSRASSPLSVDTEHVNGTGSSLRIGHTSFSTAWGNDTSVTPPRDSAVINIDPPSTPAAPPPGYASALQEFNQRPANQQTHPQQQPYVASPHNVFRPPPSAALAIFDRPPSPSFYEALQTAGQPPRKSPGFQVHQSLPNPFSSPNGSAGPKIKLSLSSLKAAATPPPVTTGGDASLPPRHPRTSMSVPQRANSLVSTDTSPYAIGRINKGKGKAKVSTGNAPETLQNNDYCAACLGTGSFLCCDGCPRSFHFMCLDPPLTKDELPEEDKWYCKACRAVRRPKTYISPYTGMFAELIQGMDDRNPSVFRLPEDIRTYFAGIQTKADGSYGSAVDARPVKFDRAGFPEERESYKLKSKGHVILCYKCKGSAAPVGPGTAQGLSIGRKIVTCDYCPLSWHLDCLEPPAAVMPSSQRKWMCPNHAAQVIPKKRTLKYGVEVVNVTQPGQPNNGLVEIIDEEAERRRIAYQNMFINGKRYKVPERIIQLDFWTKLGIKDATAGTTSQGTHGKAVEVNQGSLEESYTMESLFGGQSPLSSAPSSYLPSPHQMVHSLPTIEENRHHMPTDSSIDAAQILLSFSNGETITEQSVTEMITGRDDSLEHHDRQGNEGVHHDDRKSATPASIDTVARDFANARTTSPASEPPAGPLNSDHKASGVDVVDTSPTPPVNASDGYRTPISARKIRLRVSTPMSSSLKDSADVAASQQSDTKSIDPPSSDSMTLIPQDSDSAAGSTLKQMGRRLGRRRQK